MMNIDFQRLVLALSFLIAGGLVTAWCVACVPMKAGAEAAYTAEMLRCVDQAVNREDADECRAKVRAKWALDGGGQ